MRAGEGGGGRTKRPGKYIHFWESFVLQSRTRSGSVKIKQNTDSMFRIDYRGRDLQSTSMSVNMFELISNMRHATVRARQMDRFTGYQITLSRWEQLTLVQEHWGGRGSDWAFFSWNIWTWNNSYCMNQSTGGNGTFPKVELFWDAYNLSKHKDVFHRDMQEK